MTDQANNPVSPEKLARQASAFLETEFGGYYLAKLSELYNDEHHAAESAKSIEDKALAVERAVGLKRAIDLLTRNVELAKAGYFKEGLKAG